MHVPQPVLAERASDEGATRERPVTPNPKMRPLGRLVVVLVGAVVVFIVALVGAVAAFIAGEDDPSQPVSVTVWGNDTLVQVVRPPLALFVAAALAIVVIIAGALILESAAALRTYRSPDRQLLAQIVTTVERVPTGNPVRITVLIPAHNEAASLPVTLASLAEQSRPPDHVVVVADNCTDDTVAIARALGHEAFETVDNTHKKGGALNQALARLLPAMDADDAVLVMDADTSIGPRYLETAAHHLDTDPTLEAVGGLFFGEDGRGLIGQLQRNEYLRYSQEISRRRGRVFVLTGTASVFRAQTLKNVAAARGLAIPGQTGDVYDTSALTEDNELTIALKSLGAPMTSPYECAVVTELMPTWSDLWRQRLRWQRGALENIGAYGLTTATARYWSQQIAIAYGSIALGSYLLLMLVTLLAADQWVWFPFWIGIGLVFLAERVITVWRGGARGRLLAALLLPEILYDFFQQRVFGRALIDIIAGRRATWAHVQHAAEPERVA